MVRTLTTRPPKTTKNLKLLLVWFKILNRKLFPRLVPMFKHCKFCVSTQSRMVMWTEAELETSPLNLQARKWHQNSHVHNQCPLLAYSVLYKFIKQSLKNTELTKLNWRTDYKACTVVWTASKWEDIHDSWLLSSFIYDHICSTFISISEIHERRCTRSVSTLLFPSRRTLYQVSEAFLSGLKGRVQSLSQDSILWHFIIIWNYVHFKVLFVTVSLCTLTLIAITYL
jgi:hypothetical protein